MRLSHLIVAAALSALLAGIVGGQYQDARTAVRGKQITDLSLLVAPPLTTDGIDAGATCVSGQLYVDSAYRLYLCVPDKRWYEAGHHPYLWVRLVPDQTYLPAGYAQ